MLLTVVLEKTLESPLDCKEIQPVHPKGNQSWIFIGRTDAEAETPILWPSNVNSWFIWKDPNVGKDWRLKAGGEGDNRGWYGWMASPTRWILVWVSSRIWVWVNSGSWWWIGRPGVLQFMGSQRATELNLLKLQELVIDRESLNAAVHVAAKSQRGLRAWTELNLIPLVCMFVFMSVPDSFDYYCFAGRI